MSESSDNSPRKGPAAPTHLSRFGSMPWSQTDIASSSSLARASAPPAFDTQGKLNRRVWVLEQQLRDVEASIGAERATSQTLRDRVAELESEVKAAEGRAVDAEEREQQARRDMLGEMAAEASQHVDLAVQLEDVKDSWRREKAERKRLEIEVEQLKAQRLGLGAAQRDSFVTDPLAESARMSSRAVLRPQNINITPTTPSKTRHLAVPGDDAEPKLVTPKRSPTTSIAAHYARLEEQHTALRAEYRKLHARYLEDLKHWKEYKIAETARIDAKKERRASKKEARGALGQAAGAQEDTDAEPLAMGGCARGPDAISEAAGNPAQEDTERIEPASECAESTPTASQPRSSQISEEGVYEDEEAVVILPQRRSSQRIRSQSQRTPKAASPVKTRPSIKTELVVHDVATPTAGPSRRARVPVAARTTPWLGNDQTPTKTSPVTRSSRKARVDYDDEDIFGDGDEGEVTPANAAMRTPLVRDRGGGMDTSLRTSTLRRAVAKAEVGKIDSTESSEKRKLIDLENVSPAEKAAELKRLSKMTSKQRREYYAQYKGSGRYLAPDEVRYGVYEDYEIDPAENEGEKYQFHDVKRQRTHRKQMHGGDCECCQAYYQAIGPIPRFNQAPKWSDDSKRGEGESSRDAELREHQNQVSRHRETWRRPPTPPGYWAIGFPGTQLVQEQNELADEMHRKKEAEIHREAMHKDSKWRKKKGASGLPE